MKRTSKSSSSKTKSGGSTYNSGYSKSSPAGSTTVSPSSNIRTPSTTTTESVNVTESSKPQSASFFDMSGVVLALGIGLLLVQSSNNGQLKNFWDFLFPKDNTEADKAKLMQFSSMAMFVILLAIFSNQSKVIAGMSILLFSALWIVWAVENPSQVTKLINNISLKGN